MHFAKWYDLGVDLAWDGLSRPRTQLTGMGTGHSGAVPPEVASGAVDAGEEAPASPFDGRPRGGLTSGKSKDAGPTLAALTPDQLSDFLSAGIVESSLPSGDAARLAIVADHVARSEDVRARLERTDGLEAEVELLLREVRERSTPEENAGRLVAAGAGESLTTRLREGAKWLTAAPSNALWTVLLEGRRPLNEFVTQFLGDAFVYLSQRKTPRLIADRVRGVVESAAVEAHELNEPLVVLSHSMGGQIVYDLLSHDFDEHGSGFSIDFWCAAASQVGLFEEMRLFRRRDEGETYGPDRPVPLPERVGRWWNVWDPNDVLSYTARGIFEGVDDEMYQSRRSPFTAHSGYLEQPRFYRRFAEKLEGHLTPNR